MTWKKESIKQDKVELLLFTKVLQYKIIYYIYYFFFCDIIVDFTLVKM